MSNLEDRRAATVLTSIDYAKAFNRLSFQQCLAAFARKGASTPILRLITAFLSGRTIKVKVEQHWSTPRRSRAAAPRAAYWEFSCSISPPTTLNQDHRTFPKAARSSHSFPLRRVLNRPHHSMTTPSFRPSPRVSTSSDCGYSTPVFTPPVLNNSASPIRTAFLFDVRLNGSSDFDRRARPILYSSVVFCLEHILPCLFTYDTCACHACFLRLFNIR